jgi:epoxyqueuosine reductase
MDYHQSATNASTMNIEAELQSQALQLGFELFGIAPATESDLLDRYSEWLDRGYHGEMHYLKEHLELKRHPQSILDSVQSVVMLGIRYDAGGLRYQEQRHLPENHGKVARYARGEDYHAVIREKLNRLRTWFESNVPGGMARGVVDSAPLLERDFARRAGLGWFGKNTMLIHPELGSFFFLAGFLTNKLLLSNMPFTTSHCGSCTACIDVCPTEAIVEPGWLDARNCISYLTIELKSPIPENLRPKLDDWLFGCDLCQEVCPWNGRTQLGEVGLPRLDAMQSFDLIELLMLDENQFRERFRETAIMRTKRAGLLRNAAVLLGNSGTAEAEAALRHTQLDPEPKIQEAANWALDQLVRRRIIQSESLPDRIE